MQKGILNFLPWPVLAGIIATVVGVTTFTLHWQLWNVFNGPLPGYQVILFPGNLSLRYIWHPLFSEEIPLLLKLTLLLFGQFVVVTVFFYLIQRIGKIVKTVSR